VFTTDFKPFNQTPIEFRTKKLNANTILHFGPQSNVIPAPLYVMT